MSDTFLNFNFGFSGEIYISMNTYDDPDAKNDPPCFFIKLTEKENEIFSYGLLTGFFPIYYRQFERSWTDINTKNIFIPFVGYLQLSIDKFYFLLGTGLYYSFKDSYEDNVISYESESFNLGITTGFGIEAKVLKHLYLNMSLLFHIFGASYQYYSGTRVFGSFTFGFGFQL